MCTITINTDKLYHKVVQKANGCGNEGFGACRGEEEKP